MLLYITLGLILIPIALTAVIVLLPETDAEKRERKHDEILGDPERDHDYQD